MVSIIVLEKNQGEYYNRKQIHENKQRKILGVGARKIIRATLHFSIVFKMWRITETVPREKRNALRYLALLSMS